MTPNDQTTTSSPPPTPTPPIDAPAEAAADAGGTLAAAQVTDTAAGVMSGASDTTMPLVESPAPVLADPDAVITSEGESPMFDPSNEPGALTEADAGMVEKQDAPTTEERIAMLEGEMAALRNDIAFLRAQFRWPTNEG